MRINISGKDIYTPKWNGNLKLPEKERVTVEYRYLTCDEEEKYTVYQPKYEKETIELEVKSNANEIWDSCVLKVSGLVGDDGKEIIEAKAVRKIPGVYGLVTEVVAHIRKGFEESDQKN